MDSYLQEVPRPQGPGSKLSSSTIVPGAKRVPALGLVFPHGSGIIRAEFAGLDIVN